MAFVCYVAYRYASQVQSVLQLSGYDFLPQLEASTIIVFQHRVPYPTLEELNMIWDAIKIFPILCDAKGTREYM